jgi:hypothetical protein
VRGNDGRADDDRDDCYEKPCQGETTGDGHHLHTARSPTRSSKRSTPGDVARCLDSQLVISSGASCGHGSMGGIDRHEEFVSLARPFAAEPLTAAEMYRADSAAKSSRGVAIGVRVLIGVCALGPLVLAAFTDAYWLGARFAVLPGLAVLYLAAMALRRVRKQPNVVLMAVGARDLVVLRASFLPTQWKVLDSVGRWPLSDVQAVSGAEVLALELHIPGSEPLSVQPLAVTHDASVISAALLAESQSRP